MHIPRLLLGALLVASTVIPTWARPEPARTATPGLLPSPSVATPRAALRGAMAFYDGRPERPAIARPVRPRRAFQAGRVEVMSLTDESEVPSR